MERNKAPLYSPYPLYHRASTDHLPSTDATAAADMAGKPPTKPPSKRWPNLSDVIDLLGISCRVTDETEKERRSSCSSASVSDGSSDADVEESQRPAASPPESEKLRMFVGTWNVGGRAPHAGLNLRDWLCTPAPADIYVLGFQEVVPLNAGNILVGEDRGPASTWLDLIGQALNCSPEILSTAPDVNHRATAHPDQFRRPRVSFCDLISIEDMLEEGSATSRTCRREAGGDFTESVDGFPGSAAGNSHRRRRPTSGGYRLAASKQMVGIFLCVWIRVDLHSQVRRTKISCVARGMMGYTGNKGSISISITLRQTTFCFVCTHLASGEKEKDEVRRNSDVIEIMKRTRFARPKRSGLLPPALAPKYILQHSKVVWLGDLNYRLSSSRDVANELLQKNDWGALLERDQLRIEKRAGRIFTGWEEGRIYFPPTYKYITNSDRYAVQTMETREKRRTPAWCDRILWRGEDMKQVCYVRGESRFSDHRPVYSIFSVRVAREEEEQGERAQDMGPIERSGDHGKGSARKKRVRMGWPVKAGCRSYPGNDLGGSDSSSANSSSRVQAEEMFPITGTGSCIEIS